MPVPLPKTAYPIVAVMAIALVAGGIVGVVNINTSNATASAAQVVPAPDAIPSPTPSSAPTTIPTPSSAPTTIPTVVPKPKKPKPATRERKARNIPEMPMDKNDGRRIVYDKSLMTLWVMNKKNEVVHRFPIVGRWDRPVKGDYKIFSKSERSGNPNSKVTFDHMTRFAYGNDGKTAIGFHSIPKYYDGKMMHSIKQLGLPIATGGCVRMAAEDAETLYNWSKIGDLVVVLPSP